MSLGRSALLMLKTSDFRPKGSLKQQGEHLFGTPPRLPAAGAMPPDTPTCVLYFCPQT